MFKITAKKMGGSAVGLATVVAGLVAVYELGWFAEWWGPTPLSLEHRQQISDQLRTGLADGVLSPGERVALESYREEMGLGKSAFGGYLDRVEPVFKQVAGNLEKGSALAGEGRLTEARSLFLEAASLDPKNAHSWNNLGAVELELGMLSEARGALVKALDLDPQQLNARFNLALCLSGLGEVRQAKAELHRFFGLYREARRASRPAPALIRDELLNNPFFSSLRDDEGFEELLLYSALDPEGGAA